MNIKRLISICVIAAFALLYAVVPALTDIGLPKVPTGGTKATLVRAGGFTSVGGSGQITIAPAAGQLTNIFQPVDFAGVTYSTVSAANHADIWADATGVYRVSQSGEPVSSLVTTLPPVDLTTQGAAITATNLYASAPAGFYEIRAYFELTRAATTSSSITLSYGYTDDNGAQTVNAAAADTANTTGIAFAGGTTIYQASTGNITYAVAYSSTGATSAQYALHLRMKKLH
jgi:hypothetical protein